MFLNRLFVSKLCILHHNKLFLNGLNKTGVALLPGSDFGLSKDRTEYDQSAAKTDTRAGTFIYMSNEMVMKE